LLQQRFTDLGAQVVDGDLDRTDLGFDGRDSLLDRVGFDGLRRYPMPSPLRSRSLT